ncbi:MAG: ABC transporter permease, partial [Spirochaetes bacterium]|nr:ABC transporter permease [Spirochaetota bacterium]
MKINLLSIAFKNLGRHKVKTILTSSAIIISIGLFIFMDALLYGMDIDSRRNLINYETGAAKIYSKAYFEKKDELPMYESYGDYEPIIKKLNEQAYNAAPRAVFVGSLLSVDQELPFILIGIDPQKENTVFKYHKFLEQDSRFVQNGQFKIIIGVKGAKNLNVGIGDKVRLSTTIDIKDEKGKIKHIHQLIDMSIGGIVNSPNPKTNGNIAYLPLDILQD